MLSKDKIMETVKSRFTGKLAADGSVPGQRINLVVEAMVEEINRELAELRESINPVPEAAELPRVDVVVAPSAGTDCSGEAGK